MTASNTPNPTQAHDVAVEAIKKCGGQLVAHTTSGVYKPDSDATANAVLIPLTGLSALRAALGRPQEVAGVTEAKLRGLIEDYVMYRQNRVNGPEPELDRVKRDLDDAIRILISRAPVAVGVEPDYKQMYLQLTAQTARAEDRAEAAELALENMGAGAGGSSPEPQGPGYIPWLDKSLNALSGGSVGAEPTHEFWELLHEWRDTLDTERADWIEHRFSELLRLATPAPSVPLGGGEVAKSSAVCTVCGLGRHVAAHRPLVSGPNAGEPLDHAFTLHTEDAARETLIERLTFIAENGNDGLVASQTYADAAKLLRLDGNRPPPAEGADAWCEYIAGMIECYLTIDAPAVNREAAIAGIIQRRLHWLPSFSTTSIHALDCKRSHPHENMNPMCELRTVIARLENEKARSAPVPAGVQGDAARAKIPDYTINVPVGGGASMCIANPVTDPHIGYSLTYSGNLNLPHAGRFSAAALIDSYDYLVSDAISLKEVVRRLSLMRKARRAAIAQSTKGA